MLGKSYLVCPVKFDGALKKQQRQKSVGFATLAIGLALAAGFAPIASVANRWAIYAVSCPNKKDNCLFEELGWKNAKNKCQYVRLGCQF